MDTITGQCAPAQIPEMEMEMEMTSNSNRIEESETSECKIYTLYVVDLQQVHMHTCFCVRAFFLIHVNLFHRQSHVKVCLFASKLFTELQMNICFPRIVRKIDMF